MARQNINIGTNPNDGSGDPLRVAFRRTNENFIDLYEKLEEAVTLASRDLLVDTTGNVNDGDSDDLDIIGYKGYMLYKIETSAAAWVRIYASNGARTADVTRTQGQDPLPSSGVIAEVITTGPETVLITPGVIGFNNENPVSNVIPVSVTNLSGTQDSITITLTAVELEI